MTNADDWPREPRENTARVPGGRATLPSGPRVFLSYRRDDTEQVATLLSRRLRDDLGSRNIFRDRDDLIAGQKWSDALNRAIDAADAVVLLIGPTWLGVKGDGTRRIDKHDDPVRAEVSRALSQASRARPLPVLIDIDEMPAVPEALAPLLVFHYAKARWPSLAASDSGEYQHILVGIWESLRLQYPRGVLIIGDHAQGLLDRLVDELKHANAITASELSRFAAGAYIVTARRARQGARRWPDVIFVTDSDRPNAILAARLQAAVENETIRKIVVVGSGVVALETLLAETAAASDTAIATYPTTDQLVAAVPSAGTGVSGAVATAWGNTAMATKSAIIVAAVVLLSLGAIAVGNGIAVSDPRDTGATSTPFRTDSFAGEANGVGIVADLSASESQLVSDVEALHEAADAPPMTFIAAQIDNNGDTAVNLEAIEVNDDAGGVFSLEPAADLVRDLRSEVDLYDTDTFDQASRLLEQVESVETSVRPGMAVELLVGAPGTPQSIETVTAVGSFGRIPLRPR